MPEPAGMPVLRQMVGKDKLGPRMPPVSRA